MPGIRQLAHPSSTLVGVDVARAALRGRIPPDTAHERTAIATGFVLLLDEASRV